MDVRAGFFSDPDDIPGLAHFLEHMLFYSSEKYPKEDEYSKFIQENGGRTNAYTMEENTNYHFNISQDHLAGALDRFAQFFVCPTISKDGVDRELNAVDSENDKNLLSDAWRRQQLWKHMSRATHPYHKFGTGSLKTLSEGPKARNQDTREELLKFYTNQYSANLMGLAVYGAEPLDTLQALVEEAFTPIVDRSLRPPEFDPEPFGEEHTGILLRALPTCDGNVLELQWLTPAELPTYKSIPSHYVSHLLGHEGEGSIFALLKEKGWASGLSSGGGHDSFTAASTFSVRVDLTEGGHANVCEVIGIIFQYIDLVSREGVQQWFFDELKAVQEVRFNFRDKQEPAGYCRLLAGSLQFFPAREVMLASHAVPQVYDPEEVRAVLRCLTRERVRILWASKSFEDAVTTQEPWYTTKYHQERVPSEWLSAWASAERYPELHLPAPNEFIPTDFSIKVPKVDANVLCVPKVIRETPLTRLWYKPDTRFQAPKAFIYLDFTSPVAYSSPENSVLTRLFTKMLTDKLNAFAYYAEVAGLGYSVHNTQQGFQIVASGYNHKLMLLVMKILEVMADFKGVDVERFFPVRERLQQDYINVRYEQPYQRIVYNSSLLLEADRWHVEEYEAVVGNVTPKQLEEFVPCLMGRLFAETFISGNITVGEAETLMTSVEEMLKSRLNTQPLFPGQHKQQRVLKLKASPSVRFTEPCPNPVETNSAMDAMFQIGPDDPFMNSVAELFVQLGQRSAFHQLRTVEQLGYIVFLVCRDDQCVRSIHFLIQSSAYSCDHIEGRIESFIIGLHDILKNLSDTEFAENVQALATMKLEKPKTPAAEARRNWREIESMTHQFDRYEREVDVLRSLTQQDVLTFYEQNIAQGPTRRKLAFYVSSSTQPSEARPQFLPPPSPLCEPGSFSVAVSTKEAADTSGSAPVSTPVAQADGGSGAEKVIHVSRSNLHAFKRSAELYPSVGSPPVSML
ncbi:hypothetical protein CYMTET_28558 [Cymbomonas tetramitiformis]|uniref:Insulin-degrading enzyme n=1 Tax=Cymbomonas tetramitiformis TaxID=36881 RepID=A0AAE0KW40_9CHLO|nr:hypothetical protein CYMTET_28558 [Cymbomonas tetramitiformis]